MFREITEEYVNTALSRIPKQNIEIEHKKEVEDDKEEEEGDEAGQ